MISSAYLCGPMRGLPNYNFPAFDAAREFLTDMGIEVVNPADIDREAGFVTESPDGEVLLTEHFSIQEALRRDFAAICRCEAVACLPGWEYSSGSLAERRVAAEVGRSFWRVDPFARTLEPEVVIGLSGVARAGKDTVASLLTEHHGFQRRAFADALKKVLVALDPIVEPTGRRLSDLGLPMDQAKALPEVRSLLQRLGTEAGRHALGADIWVRTLLAGPVPQRMVVSDCRFPNEAQAIRARGGIVVRVERPGFTAINGHSSETALDDWEFDAVIVNDGAIADLVPQVADIASRVDRASKEAADV